VRRWPACSAEKFDTLAGVVVWPAGILIGLFSERAAFGWDSFARWIPDLVVGLVSIGCGVQLMTRNRGTALLLVAVGLSWFLANFWADARFLHRGVLVELLVAYPGWRPRSRLDLVAVTVGCVAAVVVPVWRSEPTSIVLGCALVGVVARGVVLASYRLRRVRRTALQATIAFSGVVFAGAVVRLTIGEFRSAHAVSLVYDTVLCGVAFWLTAGLPVWNTSSVVDLVVELGETQSGTLRDTLASTLGDPTLEVGYWDHRANYVDAEGGVVALPNAGSARSATFVQRESRPFAVLVHDAAILGEPALVESVAAATRLSNANAELQAAVRMQLAELSASRRRLVSAADEERRRLDDRLRDGAEQHLRELDDLLRCETHHCEATPRRVARALNQLTQTIDDLRELAGGLHPRELDRGLVPALESLAARSPVPVELVMRGAETEMATRTAIYYVCAEALANTVKHATATSAAIRVEAADDRVTVYVSDDGSGGADTRHGSGLRGLIDRVEALDGTLRIDSPDGVGTRLSVEIPIGRMPAATRAE
jgi:signal transduction histidine kinase